MSPTAALSILAMALAIEATAGYPQGLFAAIGHPVTWMGRLIAALDARFNDDTLGEEERRRAGILALFILIIVTGCAAELVEISLLTLPLGFVLLAAVASSLIAGRSLDEHVARVAEALEEGGLPAGRQAVSHVVGRNPEHLDRHGVARAAIESLAENFSDGVVAPAFWLLLLGLPGAAIYKAINTADSMVGHKTPRHAGFGWASARLDDLVNLPASRLSAGLIVAAAFVLPGCDPRGAIRAVRRDAGRHRSPNAGWPEAAMAGALGLKLNGPKVYGATQRDDAYMGDGRAEVTERDVRNALVLYRMACLIALVIVVASIGLILIA